MLGSLMSGVEIIVALKQIGTMMNLEQLVAMVVSQAQDFVWRLTYLK